MTEKPNDSGFGCSKAGRESSLQTWGRFWNSMDHLQRKKKEKKNFFPTLFRYNNCFVYVLRMWKKKKLELDNS